MNCDLCHAVYSAANKLQSITHITLSWFSYRFHNYQYLFGVYRVSTGVSSLFQFLYQFRKGFYSFIKCFCGTSGGGGEMAVTMLCRYIFSAFSIFLSSFFLPVLRMYKLLICFF